MNGITITQGHCSSGQGAHIFVAGGEYLDSDAVFAVKESLVKDFTPTDDPALAAEHGVPNPFRHARFDLVLERS